MIAIALPGFPSNDTHVYTIVLKTIAPHSATKINNVGDSTRFQNNQVTNRYNQCLNDTHHYKESTFT